VRHAGSVRPVQSPEVVKPSIQAPEVAQPLPPVESVKEAETRAATRAWRLLWLLEQRKRRRRFRIRRL
jgi:hypothetical protein